MPIACWPQWAVPRRAGRRCAHRISRREVRETVRTPCPAKRHCAARFPACAPPRCCGWQDSPADPMPLPGRVLSRPANRNRPDFGVGAPNRTYEALGNRHHLDGLRIDHPVSRERKAFLVAFQRARSRVLGQAATHPRRLLAHVNPMPPYFPAPPRLPPQHHGPGGTAGTATPSRPRARLPPRITRLRGRAAMRREWCECGNCARGGGVRFTNDANACKTTTSECLLATIASAGVMTVR